MNLFLNVLLSSMYLSVNLIYFLIYLNCIFVLKKAILRFPCQGSRYLCLHLLVFLTGLFSLLSRNIVVLSLFIRFGLVLFSTRNMLIHDICSHSIKLHFHSAEFVSYLQIQPVSHQHSAKI